ncbi:hypothetical protein M5K25_011485 [Dendrobium thyrsiflorum]|uniref:Uncharacterized protein n=1 Tax=Dendrobium thyrsiflorum TaxID=117978 RepID=A0ABD0VAI8_DENTH
MTQDHGTGVVFACQWTTKAASDLDIRTSSGFLPHTQASHPTSLLAHVEPKPSLPLVPRPLSLLQSQGFFDSFPNLLDSPAYYAPLVLFESNREPRAANTPFFSPEAAAESSPSTPSSLIARNSHLQQVFPSIVSSNALSPLLPSFFFTAKVSFLVRGIVLGSIAGSFDVKWSILSLGIPVIIAHHLLVHHIPSVFNITRKKKYRKCVDFMGARIREIILCGRRTPFGAQMKMRHVTSCSVPRLSTARYRGSTIKQYR